MRSKKMANIWDSETAIKQKGARAPQHELAQQRP